ncbi:MAG: hypothetical protein COX77_03515, partial [Candidatus Komeilibacteria bacterium CG_4_10_14_0_2_um_filter_37_10]
MYDLKIIAIDHIKDQSYLTKVQDYLLRLRPYARIDIQELKAESFSVRNQDKAQQTEGQKLITALSKYTPDQVYLLREVGQRFDSVQFASWLQKKRDTVVLVIAGTLGFDQGVIKKYPQSISLSALTFPHELARLI